MRIFVNSDEGGKPFELFIHEDNQLDQPGWYYMLLQPVDASTKIDHVTISAVNYEPLEDAPTGPFGSLVEAFADAIMANYDLQAWAHVMEDGTYAPEA